METNTKDFRVLIRDRETGMVISKSLGQIKISQFEPEQHEDGRYSFTAKVNVTQRINRRTRKQLRYLLRIPKRDYLPKSFFANNILRYSGTSETYDQLMKLTAHQLRIRFVRVVYALIHILYQRKKPEVRLNVNTGEATVKLEHAKHMVEQLKQEADEK